LINELYNCEAEIDNDIGVIFMQFVSWILLEKCKNMNIRYAGIDENYAVSIGINKNKLRLESGKGFECPHI
jgi:hypothetical protein